MNVGLTDISADGAKDDVHLLETAAFRFGKESKNKEFNTKKKENEMTYEAKTAIPAILIVPNMKKSL